MSRLSRYPRPLALGLILSAGLMLLAFANIPARGQMSENHALTAQNMVVPVNSFQPQLAQPAGRQGPDLPGAAELTAATGGKVRISTNPATGAASFVRLLDGASLDLAPAAAQPQDQARAFWAQYGSLFGVSAPDQELRLVATSQDAYGLTHLNYEQVYQDVKVFGGELQVHLNQSQAITSVNGVFIPGLNLDVHPARSAAEAASLALDLLASQGKTGQLAVADNQLVIYRTGLAQRLPGRNALAYALEITSSDHSLREFVFIDAQSGKLLDQYSGVQEGLSRKISEGSLGNIVWQDSAGDPDPIPSGWHGYSDSLLAAWQDEIAGARETYNMFASMNDGSYLSYDGNDAVMRTVNNDPTISCPNANWNGTSTNYCDGVTGDDTVAHEWGHAYTEYTNNLIYAWQPGALNESYSDIWGEVVDMLNGRGTDAPLTLRTANTCSLKSGFPGGDNSYRWLSGEDDTAFGGAIRDLWNPTCYNDPGKVSDSQYYCRSTDSGGVHTNSGVPNHAFALMVDGGTYNGQTLTGIGLTKAAHIEWSAQQRLVSTSDFSDNADALEAACTALIGVDLPSLSTSATSAGSSGQKISGGDCSQVSKAIAAVEFRSPPTQCNFSPMLNPNTPAQCSSGSPAAFFSQDWESGLGAWTVGKHNVANSFTFNTHDWAVVGSLPDARPGQAAFVEDYQGGNCTTDDESGALNLDSPAITIPAGVTNPILSFDHWVSTEAGWDGGNLKVKVNNGGWNLVPTSAFTFNQYPANLNVSQNTNPLAGQPAFTGSDGGSVSGSWGTSRVDLTGIAGPGDSVRLRFDMGVDGCSGLIGWYVDNVQVYSCGAATPPTISLAPSSLSNLQMPDLIANKNLTINNAGASPLSWSVSEVPALPKTAPIGATSQPLGELSRQPVVPNPAPAVVARPSLAIVQDGSFEAGTPNPYWAEASTNFGTPLCDSSCGGPPAATGSWYAWFGGAIKYEDGAITQSVTIPTGGQADLTFKLLVGGCINPLDYLEVRVDGQQVYKVDSSSPLCNVSSYSQQQVSLGAYADGGSHTLVFHSESYGTAVNRTNFFVDDVAISLSQEIPWLSASVTSGTIPGLSSFNLPINFNSTGLSDGLYQGSLSFNSNDPAHPVVLIPISLQVSSTAGFRYYLPASFIP